MDGADDGDGAAPSLLSSLGFGLFPGPRQHFQVHSSAMANPAAAPTELAFLLRNMNPRM